MEFKPLTLEDKELFYKYLTPYTFETCEYSFNNLYIWREGCNIEYSILNEALIIKKVDFDGATHFMQPIKYKKENLKEILDTLIKFRVENNLTYLFKDAEEEFIKDFKEIYGDDFIIEEDRDNFDYIYESSNLISLSGKILHKKKNHYNYFVKNFTYEIKEITEDIIEECINAANEWCKKNDCTGHLSNELKSIKELLLNIKKLDYDGIAVFIDGKIAAFTIGEKMSDELAIIHIEKASTDYRGLYNFINKTFIEKYYSIVKYINREQDLGLEGLRQAKLSYQPVKLAKKFNVK